MAPEEALTFWLGRNLLQSTGSVTQELVLDEIEAEVNDGTPFNVAVAAVSTHSARPGDFGVEIASSMLAVMLVEALRTFWSAYLAKLQDKMVGQLADLTLERAKRLFVGELKGRDQNEIVGRIETALREEAARRELAADQVEALVAVLRDPKVMAGFASPA